MFDQIVHKPSHPFNHRLAGLSGLACLAGLAGLMLTACLSNEPEGFTDAEARAIELRGGAAIVLRPGTALNLDELDEREGYGATLTDGLGQAWFIRVEALGDDLVAELGLERIVVDGAEAHLGTAWNDDGGGNTCLIHVPFAVGTTVALSRLEGADPCPEHADDLGWLPAVHANENGSASRPNFDITDGTDVVRGGCGQVFHPSVSGGEATWTLSCAGGYITMKGWVKDTSWGIQCAYVQGVFNGNINKLATACGSGTKTSFTWTYPGTIANGYLMVK